MIEEGENHVQARAEYHRKLSEYQEEVMQGNQLIVTAGGEGDDSDEFQDTIEGMASSSSSDQEQQEEDEESRE